MFWAADGRGQYPVKGLVLATIPPFGCFPPRHPPEPGLHRALYLYCTVVLQETFKLPSRTSMSVTESEPAEQKLSKQRNPTQPNILDC